MLENKTLIKVKYSEVDLMGIVHNAKYFEYFEIARLDLIEKYICMYREFIKKYNTQIPVIENSAKYFKPVRLQDPLEVTASVKKFPKKRLVFDYEIHVKNKLIAIGASRHAYIKGDIMKSVEIPEELEAIISPYFQKKD